MYSISGGRELGEGGIPVLVGVQKITPEWQSERLCPVGAVVARVKGKRHACGV